MRLSVLLESPALTYRWTDERTALDYIRRNAIRPFHRHCIPETNQWLKGISTSPFATKWALGKRICFVLDLSRIPNRRFTINGQAVYTYGQYVEMLANILRSRRLTDQEKRTLNDYRWAAQTDSAHHPDEIFIAGFIRNLSDVCIRIVLRQMAGWEKESALIREFAHDHHIEVTEVAGYEIDHVFAETNA